MNPGEIIPSEAPDLLLNQGLESFEITVTHTGDRPIQVGSHYHFAEVNTALQFDRERCRGFRLNIPSGTAVRFEPGDTRSVSLVAYAGQRIVIGFLGDTNGPLDKGAL
ncbi:MAG TPA: urease subunit beta [Kiritimatiellia bacterium]|nr:urease subunit beta [Kiritimatiellia bacterium]